MLWQEHFLYVMIAMMFQVLKIVSTAELPVLEQKVAQVTLLAEGGLTIVPLVMLR